MLVYIELINMTKADEGGSQEGEEGRADEGGAFR